MLLEVTFRLLETFKLCTKQSLVTFGLGFKPLLQITEHLVVMFVVPQTGKQATKQGLQYMTGERVGHTITAIKNAKHHSWCKSLLSTTPISYGNV